VTRARRRRHGSREPAPQRAGREPARPEESPEPTPTVASAFGPLSRRDLALALGVLVAALAVVAYLPALNNPFVYDDAVTVRNNASIHDLGNWRAVLLGSRRPVVNLSYAVSYALSGTTPFGHHLLSVLVHALNAVLLFGLIGVAWRDARERRGLAAAPAAEVWAQLGGASLFAVHPLATEAVGYVSGRAGVLCTTFVLLAVLAVRRGLARRRGRWLAAGIGCYVLAVASKETAAMLPFVFLVYDRLLLPGTREDRRWRFWRCHFPLLALTALAGAWRVRSYVVLEGGHSRSLGYHWLTQLGVVWRYVGLLLIPVSQSVVHSVVPVSSLLAPWPWLAGAGLLASLYLALRFRARAPLVAFGWLWFLLLLVPSSAIALNEHLSEHRVYEASAGIFLLVGFLFGSLHEEAARRRVPWRTPLLAGLVAGLAITLTAATMARLKVWSSAIALWTDAVAKAPDVWAPRYALATAYMQAGQQARAAEEYRKAIEVLPTEPRAHENLGIALARLGRFAEAQAAFEAAIKLSSSHELPGLHHNLGVMYVSRGRPELARESFRRAIELDPSYVKPRLGLARLYRTVLGDPEAALKLCQEALRLAPASAEAATCVRQAEAALQGGTAAPPAPPAAPPIPSGAPAAPPPAPAAPPPALPAPSGAPAAPPAAPP
jgi:Tfp pilus assembly protein PilF